MDVQQQKIDKYTKKTRRRREGGVPIPFFLHRIRNGVEGANRKFWYGLLRLLLQNKPVSRRIPAEQLTSLLIIPYGEAIGDLIVSLAAARVVKSRNPNCKVGIITSHRNESLLRCDPNFDAQYEFTGRSDTGNYKNLRRARKQKYQVVLNLHFQRMSDYGLISNYISPSGIKVSVQHKRGEMYKILFNHLTEARRFKVHLSQLGLKLLDDVVDFSKSPIRTSESRPQLTICDDTLSKVSSKVDAILRETGALWFIYVNPQARNATREWGIENNLALCDILLEKYQDACVVMTSAPVAQADLKAAIARHGNPRIQVFDTGYDLNELVALCQLSRLIITPDTSVVHIASAVNKPCLVFYVEYGETPREWLPLMVPSYQFGPKTRGASVSTVSVGEAFEAAVRLIEGHMQATASSDGLDPMTPAPYQAINADRELIPLIEPEINQGIH